MEHELEKYEKENDRKRETERRMSRTRNPLKGRTQKRLRWGYRGHTDRRETK
jgi:hypothetical protein